MVFGDELKRLREVAGLSQSALADVAGVPLRSIQNWEQGHRVPKAEALLALSKPLKATLEQLVAALAQPPAEPPGPSARGKTVLPDVQTSESGKPIGDQSDAVKGNTKGKRRGKGKE